MVASDEAALLLMHSYCSSRAVFIYPSGALQPGCLLDGFRKQTSQLLVLGYLHSFELCATAPERAGIISEAPVILSVAVLRDMCVSERKLYVSWLLIKITDHSLSGLQICMLASIGVSTRAWLSESCPQERALQPLDYTLQ